MIADALTAALELSREPIHRLIEGGSERFTTAMRNDTVAAREKDARLDLLCAMVVVEFDHGVVDAWFETLEALDALMGFHSDFLRNVAMTCGDVDLHSNPHVTSQ
jgi:hypothetical protein